ncbi:MAG: putative lipid II flippase FtsW [Candidatus Omnitrophica bacterium]|nr:putative lipid II flippase FtsW [Candidatus Omnitrophota bacterium]
MEINAAKERRFIFFAILSLTLFGLLMVYESSSIYAFKTTGDSLYFLKRQFVFFLMALVSFFLTLFADLEFLRKHNKELLIFTFLLLIAVLIVGRKTGGARRWFNLFYFNFQPSEMLKISFLLYCADYFRRKGSFIKNFFGGVLPLGVILGSMCFLLVLQPDLGSAVFWMIWTLFFLFLCRAKQKHIIWIVIVGLILIFFLVKFYPYRFRRITAYLNPFADPKGAGFQLIQSQIAYGEGGLFGVGLGEGRQKLFFLPAAHTDFIFSIIAEEFGLFTITLIFCFLFTIFHRMLNVVKITANMFKKNILLGIVLIFFLEIVINIGVSCGLLPTKGLSFPFVSYGGSNMIAHYILLGLFFNASRQRQEKIS